MSLKELSEIGDKRAIINPRESQAAAILFFKALLAGNELVCENKNPFDPKVGLYLIGPPGCGKTHILAGAATLFHKMLWKQLQRDVDAVCARIDQEIKRQECGTFRVIESTTVTFDSNGEEGSKKKGQNPEERQLQELVSELREKLQNSPYKPTDLIWVEFDRLYELVRKGRAEELLQQILNAKMLFLDDPHPKGVDERFHLIQRLIEERYNSGRMGTFITSNLEVTSMANKESGQNASDLIQRLQSRCAECYVTIKVDGLDWRKVVGSRQPKLVHGALMAEAKKEVATKRKNLGLPAEPKDGEL